MVTVCGYAIKNEMGLEKESNWKYRREEKVRRGELSKRVFIRH